MCLFKFGTDPVDPFQHLWIHRHGVKYGRHAVHADGLDDVAFGLSVATPPKAAVRRLSQDWPLRCSLGFSSSMGWEAAPSQKVSNFVESALGWSCLHYGFTQIIFTAGGAILERMVRIPGQSTQASSSSQKFYVHSAVDGGRRLRWSLHSPSRGHRASCDSTYR